MHHDWKSAAPDSPLNISCVSQLTVDGVLQTNTSSSFNAKELYTQMQSVGNQVFAFSP